jgi:hypothetical protein
MRPLNRSVSAGPAAGEGLLPMLMHPPKNPDAPIAALALINSRRFGLITRFLLYQLMNSMSAGITFCGASSISQ